MNGETSKRLRAEFDDIDIYVFDQLLKGRIEPGMRVLDAGCGGGRNIHYLMKHGYDVWGVDVSEEAIAGVRDRATELAIPLADMRFSVQRLESLNFPDAIFDVVICSTVLHFARDEAHWYAMAREIWRVLKPGGMLFTRMASTIGQESGALTPLGGRRYTMADGSERFLVDEDYLMMADIELNGRLLEPIKTTVVQKMRSMTTWVVEKL